MLEEIVIQKIEPATIVLDSLQNIVFSNSKANKLLKNSVVKKKLLQLTKLLVEQSTNKNKQYKIASLKINRRNFSLQLEHLHLKKNKQVYYLVKIEDNTKVQNIENVANVELVQTEKSKKVVDKQLLINEENLRLTFENSNKFMARTGADGQLIEHNYSSKFHQLNKKSSVNPKYLWNFQCFKYNKFAIEQIKKAYKSLKQKKKIHLQVSYKTSTNTKGILELTFTKIYKKRKVDWILVEGNDITDIINFKNQINLNELKFRAVFYNTHNFMARLSPNGIVLEHNRYGNSSKDSKQRAYLIEKPIWTANFFNKSKTKINQVKKDIKLCSRGKIVNNEIEYYFKTKIDPLKLEYTLKPIFDSKKNLAWILLECTNISSLRNTQNELNKSLAKAEYLFENSLVALAIIDENLQLKETNKAFSKITGYTAEEVNQIGYLNLLYKKDTEKAKNNIQLATKRKLNTLTFKRRFITKTKQLKTANVSFKPLYENGIFIGALISLSDITELETKRQQLNDNITKYKSLFDNNVTGLSVGDADGKLLKVNKALCDILGYRSKELLQMSHKQLSDGNENDEYAKLFKDLLKGKIKKFTATKKFIKKDKKIIDTITNVSGVFNEENEFLYSITSIADISEIKKLEGQLANKVVELEKYIESNLELENFAFLASHDLRAPLVTVLSFTKILQSTLKNKISKNEYAYLGHISSGINRLQQSINDLLDFSSVSNNQLKIKEIETKTLLNDIIKDYEAIIKDSNAKIIVKKIPQKINIDISLYTRLISNLLSNSLKFVKKNTTPKIEIGCRSYKNFHQFYFKDNGIGIPKKKQEKVFGIFKRLHPNEVFEGTGIGLALCKKVVERHSGKLWIKSEFGKGCTFYFTLPINKI